MGAWLPPTASCAAPAGPRAPADGVAVLEAPEPAPTAAGGDCPGALEAPEAAGDSGAESPWPPGAPCACGVFSELEANREAGTVLPHATVTDVVTSATRHIAPRTSLALSTRPPAPPCTGGCGRVGRVRHSPNTGSVSGEQ